MSFSLWPQISLRNPTKFRIFSFHEINKRCLDIRKHERKREEKFRKIHSLFLAIINVQKHGILIVYTIHIWNVFWYQPLLEKIEKIYAYISCPMMWWVFDGKKKKKSIPIIDKIVNTTNDSFGWANLHFLSLPHDLTCLSTFQIKSYIYVHLFIVQMRRPSTEKGNSLVACLFFFSLSQLLDESKPNGE